MQEVVLGRHPAIDDAADILPHHGFMGEDGALRQRLRAAGVDDLCGIAAVDRGFERRGVIAQQIVEGGDARRRDRRILARQPNQFFDGGALGRCGLRHLDEIRTRRQQFRP